MRFNPSRAFIGAVAVLVAMLAWRPSPAAAASPAPAKKDAEPAALKAVFTSWLNRPELSRSLVGIEAMELPTGRVLFSFNGNRRFVPASSAKLFTAACAMETLGPQYRFHTRLLAGGAVRRGKIEGDLLVEPGQDPSLTSDDVKLMLAAVAAKGIRQVEGRVRVLPFHPGGDYFSPAWLAEDWGQEWMPVSSDLVIDRNTVGVRTNTLPLPTAKAVPGREAATVFNTILAADGEAGWAFYDSASRKVILHRVPDRRRRTVSKAYITANPGELNPALVAALAGQSGIKVEGKSLKQSGAPPTLLAEHSSRPLADLVSVTLEESDNLYAQQLLRTLGATNGGSKQPAYDSLEDAGLAHLRRWLATVGVPSQEVVLWDGCGLSRKSCASPHSLNMVLKRCAGEKADGPLLALMRSEGAPGGARGSFRFKTGAMGSVKCVSGVLRTAGGQTLAVTVMVNGHLPSVREVRLAIASLTSSLRALTSLETPAVTPPPRAPAASAPRRQPPRRAPAARKPAPAKRGSAGQGNRNR